jgi:hypothetical protein
LKNKLDYSRENTFCFDPPERLDCKHLRKNVTKMAPGPNINTTGNPLVQFRPSKILAKPKRKPAIKLGMIKTRF